MSASRTAPSRTSEQNKPYPSRFVLQHKEHKVLVKLPSSRQDALYRYLQEQAVKLFSDVGDDSAKVTFWTSEVPEFEGEELEISPDTLPGLLDDGIRRLAVKIRANAKAERHHECLADAPEPDVKPDLPISSPQPSGNRLLEPDVKPDPPTSSSQPSDNGPPKLTVRVYSPNAEKDISFRCAPNMMIKRIMEVMENVSGIRCDEQHWSYEGVNIPRDATLASLGVKDNDMLDMWPPQKGAKPVIYLYPTTATRISTTLSLVPEWEFSAIYPVVQAKTTENGQELKWVVDAEPSGILTEVETGMEVSYLYWEAETTGKGLLSPPLSPVPGATTVEAPFVPNRASLDSKDTVLLEVAKITPYLDGALKALGLHVEARTSFITYWLPALLKHEYVALRFLPQSAYEHAAPLKVDPIPDVVSRIFMLFKGVEKCDLAVWSEARERAVEDVGRWTDVVGVDVEKVQDAGLFRVIEWGGMEDLV